MLFKAICYMAWRWYIVDENQHRMLPPTGKKLERYVGLVLIEREVALRKAAFLFYKHLVQASTFFSSEEISHKPQKVIKPFTIKISMPKL
jgi:hypothetical protein